MNSFIVNIWIMWKHISREHKIPLDISITTAFTGDITFDKQRLFLHKVLQKKIYLWKWKYSDVMIGVCVKTFVNHKYKLDIMQEFFWSYRAHCHTVPAMVRNNWVFTSPKELNTEEYVSTKKDEGKNSSQ